MDSNDNRDQLPRRQHPPPSGCGAALREVALVFLKLGTAAFGGSAPDSDALGWSGG